MWQPCMPCGFALSFTQLGQAPNESTAYLTVALHLIQHLVTAHAKELTLLDLHKHGRLHAITTRDLSYCRYEYSSRSSDGHRAT